MQFITTGNRIMTENFSVGLFYTITFQNGNILACTCNGIGENFVSFLCVDPVMQFILDLTTAETIDTIELYGGGAGTMNYNELENKPSINGESLVGNLTTTDLHIRAVPPIDTTDNNKVLTASYAGGVTSYSWQTVPTGTTNYNDLINKPEINGHVLSGNQLSSQLGLATSAQGALADTAIQPADLANYQPLIDSSHKLDPALIETDTTHQFATQSQLDQITTNQNNISKAVTELIELVDSGAKNLCSVSTMTYTGSGGYSATYNLDATIPAGDYTFDCDCTRADSTKAFQIRLIYSDDSVYNIPVYPESGATHYTVNFTATKSIKGLTMYCNTNTTLSNIMLCSKAAWDVSQKYVPYRPSYEETVEQVATNKNNILSLTDALSQNTFSTPTIYNNLGTIDYGGYMRIGDLIVLNMRITTTTDITGTLCENMPLPVNPSSIGSGSTACAVYNNRSIPMAITNAGKITVVTGSTLPTGMTIISAVYMAEPVT